jgi:hypothetical protein
MSDRELIFKAATLARSAPEDWKEFLGALTVYTDNQISNCVSSPLEMLPQNQGRAQASVAILRMLRDCLKTADQIEGKRK